MSAPPFRLDDRVIVLTGGLGQLGRQYARAMVASGARVAILDADTTAAPEVEDPERLLVVAADITDETSVRAAAAAVADRWGGVDGLVNNAAIDAPPGAGTDENGPFESYPMESWDRIMKVNVAGTVVCCQVFGGAMAAAGYGSIVNVASIYGVVSPDQRLYDHLAADGIPFVKPASYAVSKAGVLMLTRYLATYWSGAGVRVNALTLGGVRRQQDEQFLAGYEARVPLGRMAREDEYNGGVVFLLSDASSYMTGASLVMDGGWTSW